MQRSWGRAQAGLDVERSRPDCSVMMHSAYQMPLLLGRAAWGHIAANAAMAATQNRRSLPMLDQIKGLHHVTSMASDARLNNDFFTNALGLRRVKKTVNFDAPDVYHLYYGDETGAPGTIMTYFPFPKMAQGRPGTGEVGTTVFSVPQGSIGFWSDRLNKLNVTGLKTEETFGEKRLNFAGPDGDGFALVEVKDDSRLPWTHGGISEDHAIRGFHSVAMRLRDDGATSELLKFMGYEVQEERD